MTDDLHLPGKWRLKAHGQTLILRKRKLERSGHVIMKGLLWALYLPQYPQPWRKLLGDVVEKSKRTAPVELLAFPPDSRERFVSDTGEVEISPHS